MKKEFKITLNDLWWIPAALPLLLIITSFLMGGWYWGLMDDTFLLSLTGNIAERISYYISFLSSDGRLIPLSCIHCVIFYKIFAGSPTAFYIFRWCEIIFALCLWGAVAYQVTGKKWPIALFFAVTLSFHNFYDSFFIFTLQEPLGLLFSAPAVYFFLKATQPALDHSKNLNWRYLFFSFLFLIIAVGMKETFCIVAAALGICTVLFSFKQRNFKKFFGLGILFFILSVLYVVFLKIWIVHNYSSGYNFYKSMNNAEIWFKNILVWHLPWIFIAMVVMMMRVKPVLTSRSHHFALVLSILLYSGYTCILLPWSTWGYYQIPLSVFFALAVTIYISNYFDNIPRWLAGGMIAVSLLFNLYTASSVMRWEYTYQQDTKNLLIWMAQNVIFDHEVTVDGAVVRGNGQEACATIPKLLKMRYGKEYPTLIFTSKVSNILRDTKTKYYLWGRYWGDQDLRLIGRDMWVPMFVSEHWIMFRRMF